MLPRLRSQRKLHHGEDHSPTPISCHDGDWKSAYVNVDRTATPLWNEIRGGAGIFYPHMYVFPCTDLIFGEIQTNHDVVLLPTAEDYENCAFPPTSELLSAGGAASFIYKIGASNIGKTLYFACGKANHCEEGHQKVAVTVMDPNDLKGIFGTQLGSAEFDAVEGLAVDPTTGDIVIAGWSFGNIEKAVTGVYNSGSSSGGTFLASLSGVNGEVKWFQTGEESNERIKSIAIDTASNIYVTGQWEYKGDGGVAEDTMYSSFVRKYDKDGRLRVDHKMPRRYLQFPVDIDVDESRVYLTQMSSESDHRLVGDNSGYGGDFIGEVIALDKHSFQQIWQTNFHTDEGKSGNPNGSDAGMGRATPDRDVLMVATEVGDAHLVIAGVTSGGGLLMGGDADESLVETGFLTKLDKSTGASSISTRLIAGQHISGVCLDNNENVFAVGFTRGSDTVDAFASKLLGADLSVAWRETYSSEREDFPMGCAVENRGSNSVFITGMTMGAMTGVASDRKGGYDLFALSLNTVNGDVRWKSQIGTKEDEAVMTDNRLGSMGGIMVDPNGDVIIAGNTRGEMFAKGMGNSDVFVLKINGHEGTIPQLITNEGIDVREANRNIGDGVLINSTIGLLFLVFVVVVGCIFGYKCGKNRTESKYGKLVEEKFNGVSGNFTPHGAAVMCEVAAETNGNTAVEMVKHNKDEGHNI